MPQTNAEIQRKFRERQLLYNHDEYLQKKRDNYKKYYKNNRLFMKHLNLYHIFLLEVSLTD